MSYAITQEILSFHTDKHATVTAAACWDAKCVAYALDGALRNVRVYSDRKTRPLR